MLNRNFRDKPKIQKWAMALPAAAMSIALITGCDGPYVKEFREVAGSNLQSGVLSVLTGVVDGVFAVYEPDNPDATDSTT